MSKKSQVLEAAERLARNLGASPSAVERIKEELSTIWGGDDRAEAAAPAAPRTTTFNVQVGVEVLASVGARQSDVEEAVRQALSAAASRRDEVVSFSVAGA
jgi:tRNA nucleotidyltransferase/poly(A) polymerase